MKLFFVQYKERLLYLNSLKKIQITFLMGFVNARWICAVCLIVGAEAASVETAFVTGWSDGAIYAFDPASPSTPATSIMTGFFNADGIAVSPDGSTAYFTVYTRGGDVYSFPTAGPYAATALNTGTDGSLAGIAISSDGSLGLMVTDAAPGGALYSFPTSGPSHAATTLTATGLTINEPSAIAISTSTAFAGGANSAQLYEFAVNSSTYNASVFQPDLAISALAVSSDGYLYYAISSGLPGAVYRVLVTGGSPVQVANPPASNASDGLAVSSDGTTVFIAAKDFGVYSFPTNAGFPQTPTFLSGLNILNAASIVFAQVPSLSAQIPLTGLKGNNLIFATHLNQNAPQSTIRLFSSLPAGDIAAALKAAAPTRNAVPVFVADNALFFTTQATADHLQQRRLRRHFSPPVTSSKELGALMAAASDAAPVSRPQRDAWGQTGHYGIWAEAIGDYAHEKAQDQTPAFSVGTGGLVTGFDIHHCDRASVGAGLAYLYSSLHEERGAGKASINQGAAMIYGEYNFSHVYLDLGLWGGYYHIDHTRHIAFTGVDFNAKSSPHGWQCLPHLELGASFGWPQWEMEPFVMFDWANSWEMEFTEQGAPGLNVSQKQRYSSMLRSEGGLRFYETVRCSWGLLTFLEKGSYVNKAPFHTGSVTAILVGSPGSFTVDTFSQNQNLFVGQFEMIFNPSKESLPKFALGYQGEFGVPYQSHQVTFTIEKTF